MIVKNLVWEGGGTKGLAYAGALLALEEKDLLKNVERVAGASAGSMAATLLALGYTVNEIKEILTDLYVGQFIDTKFPPFGLWNLFTKYGWNTGKKVEEWFGGLIENSGIPKNVTFAQLRALKKACPILYIKGTNITKGTSVTFSANTTPDFSVLKAVRISMSIPVFFTAPKFLGDKYSDGGVLNNYPIRLFDGPPFHTSDKPNPYTLGFKVDSSKEIKNENIFYGSKNIVQFLRSLVQVLYDKVQEVHYDEQDWCRTVFINTEEMSALDFNLSRADKQFLIEAGRKATKNFLDNKQ